MRPLLPFHVNEANCSPFELNFGIELSSIFGSIIGMMHNGTSDTLGDSNGRLAGVLWSFTMLLDDHHDDQGHWVMQAMRKNGAAPGRNRMNERQGWLATVLGSGPVHACNLTVGGSPGLLSGERGASTTGRLRLGLKGPCPSASS